MSLSLIVGPKQGFAVPLDAWLRNGLQEWASDMLSPSNLKQFAPIKASDVRELWRQHLSGQDNHGHRLWTVLMLMEWLRTYQSRIAPDMHIGNAR